jgi:hypothetical protein
MRVSDESILAADSHFAKPDPQALRCSGCGRHGRTDRDPVFVRSAELPPLLKPVSGWGDGDGRLCRGCAAKLAHRRARRAKAEPGLGALM